MISLFGFSIYYSTGGIENINGGTTSSGFIDVVAPPVICFSFHINTIQHDLIVTTGVIITSTTIPERWLCIFIDRIFLFSLIY
jgi:hypothetical protein